MTWHTTPEARAILADCAANPPEWISRRRDYYQTSDEWASYDETDPRVARLSDIQREVMRRAGDWTPAWKACALVTVDEAIDAVQPRMNVIREIEENIARRERLRAEIFGEDRRAAA